ncbi:DUF362 domain-containing protein [Candidatus Bathyarchaeota archaeon]|nr:DUF362 domain-containing protein [Candidatus Bathyarchaeota archaeon]
MKTNVVQNKVSVLEITARNVQSEVKTGLALIGGLNLQRDSAVVIKPNLCCIKPPETGATTDVKVIEGIVNYLRNEFGIYDISIVESDGTQVLADIAFKLLGYEKLSKKLNLNLVNLSKAPFFVKKFPQNALLKEVKFPEVFEKADFFISVPKIKTHIDCMFTCALKNQFGCNPDPRKVKYHKRLNDAIVDLNIAFKPNLVVVDGIVAMEGYRGPTDGLPVKMNKLIFGTDPVAVDHLVARMMGLDPNDVSHIVEAERRSLGKTDYITIGINTMKVERQFTTTRPKLSNFYCLFRSH